MNIRSVKLWVNIATILALALLLYFSRQQIADALDELGRLNYFWLFMIIPLQLTNYLAVAKYYQSYLSNLGEKVKLSVLYRVGLEMNFVNNVFPSGGVSGLGYFGIRMKHEGVPTSKAALTQVMRHTLTYLSFIIYLAIALIILALFGNASRLIVLISSTIIFGILLATGLLVYIISSSARIKQFVAFLPKLVNRLGRLLFRGRVPSIDIERIERLLERLHGDYLTIHRDWRQLRKPFFWTMLMNLSELLTIMVVYFAFGTTVNFGALIIAYAVANIAGLVAVLPGGVGIYEGLMTAVLASSGIPRALALSATIVYRVINMAIFLPVGFVFYQLALRTKKVPPVKERPRG